VLRNRSIVIATLISVLSLLVAGLGLIVSVDQVAASEPAPDSAISDPGGMADTELLEALEAAGVLQAWFEGTNRSPATAMLAISGDEVYESSRREIIDQAREVAEAFETRNEIVELRNQRSTLNREYADLITASILDGPMLAANAAAIESLDKTIVKLSRRPA